MDIYRPLWSPMDAYRFIEPYGSLLAPMATISSCRSLWSPMGPYGGLGTPMDPYGALWTHMEPCGAPRALWIPME